MANIKIGDLVTLGDPISTDVLPIVDVSADTTNKISIEELLKNAAAGTASLPAFAFDADPNTGMYRSGADELGFSTGGSERLKIDSSGKLIAHQGTATLGTAGSTNGVINSPESIFINIDSDNDSTGQALVVGSNRTGTTGGSELFRINEAGNVGIGTPAPVGPFHLVGDTSADSEYSILNVSDTSDTTKALRLAYDDVNDCGVIAATDRGTGWKNVVIAPNLGNVGIRTSTPGEALDVNGTVKIGNTKLYSTGSGGTFDLRLQTYSGGFFDRVAITGAGNVGIGTTSPGRTLDVSGSIRSGGSTNPYIALNDQTTEAYFEISGSETRISSGASQPLLFRTGSDERVRIKSDGTFYVNNPEANSYHNGVMLDPLGKVAAYTNDGVTGSDQRIYIYNGDTNSYKASINSNGGAFFGGNVGIGTSSPQDNLQVGADSTAHIAIANSGGTDVTSGINWRFGSAGTTYSKILSAASGAGATYLSFYTSSSEQVRIDSSGDVEIMQGKNLTWVYAGGSTHRARIRAESDDALIFENGYNNTERMRILSGGGLTFNGDTAQANALDDYEEGTWTPTIKSDANTISWTGGNSAFTYTKIGRKVTVTFNLDGATTSGTTGGRWAIDGLPFTSQASGPRTVGTVVNYYGTGLIANHWPTFVHLNRNASAVEIYYKTTNTGNYDQTTVGGVGANSYVFWQITYFV